MYIELIGFDDVTAANIEAEIGTWCCWPEAIFIRLEDFIPSPIRFQHFIVLACLN